MIIVIENSIILRALHISDAEQLYNIMPSDWLPWFGRERTLETVKAFINNAKE